MTAPALVLLAHGSPDPDWRGPLEEVVARMQQRAPEQPVVLAFMDFIEPSLDVAVTQLHGHGHRHISVVAAFLSAGGRHLKRDVPALVAQVSERHPGVDLELLPGALGENPDVIEALAGAALTHADFVRKTGR